MDLNPLVTNTGYISYLEYLDESYKMTITKEIKELDHDREKKYYSCDPATFNTLVSMKHNRLFVRKIKENANYLKPPVL